MTDQTLAARYAPVFMLDRAEPYQPYAAGWTVFRTRGKSPSSKFEIEPVADIVVEYAVFYDWDIGHLYDLEHVWVHIDADGGVARVEASSHGGRLVMDAGEGWAEFRNGRPVVYVEAGKHAHWASPHLMTAPAQRKLAALCGPLAGLEGVHLDNDLAKAGHFSASAADHRRARLKMQRDSFVPSQQFVAAETEPVLMPWPDLAAAIPGRVEAQLQALAEDRAHLAAIFIDCGDTLVDERTEVKEPGSEIVLRGDLIPGAKDMMLALKAAGYPLVLVADGPRQTFENLLQQHGLWDVFDAHIISSDIGALKPDARMFDAALAALGLARDDAWRCVMIGNNLSRDIKGANALGIVSVFMAWSTLRTHVPADASEVPDFRIAAPARFPGLLDKIEALLPYRMPVQQSGETQ
ncbi:MAG: HAD-IA family hydrolase [Devosia sp.]|uniref:HAD family hydrolase n=1 Tax=Devosia sp. TaxID=1871048 RepID=UPI0024C5D2CB|nr:HAD family hydrolase [Devosia sp.]UYO00552.1 MAG: HAD-IA family hydrolase [Devosia sp.]